MLYPWDALTTTSQLLIDQDEAVILGNDDNHDRTILGVSLVGTGAPQHVLQIQCGGQILSAVGYGPFNANPQAYNIYIPLRAVCNEAITYSSTNMSGFATVTYVNRNAMNAISSNLQELIFSSMVALLFLGVTWFMYRIIRK